MDGMFIIKFGIFVFFNFYGVFVSNNGWIIVFDWDED